MPYDELKDGHSLGVQRGKINSMTQELYDIKLEASDVLTRNNTSVYSPTLPYHPATKGYADGLRTAWEVLYNPQEISADVFARGNHTGLLDPDLVDTDSDKRFVSDADVANWDGKENDIGTHNTAFNKNFGITAGTVSEGSRTYTANDVGLGLVDNTADVNKPISTDTQSALNLKETANANIQGHISATTGNPHDVTKAEVGLGNVDNTSDVNKTISSEAQAALDLKVNQSVFDETTKYADQLDKLMDGFALEKVELSPLIVIGDKVYQDIRSESGGDWSFVVSGETLTLNCTTGDGVDGRARVEVLQGVQGKDKWSITYAAYDETAGAVVLFNSEFIPASGFGSVSYNSIESYTEISAHGPIVFQRITDITGDGELGALHYERENVRLAKRNNRVVGIDGDMTISVVAALPDKIQLTTTPGTAYQMHRQIWPFYDTDVTGIFTSGMDGSGAITNLQKLDHIGQLTETANGVALVNGDVMIFDVYMNINSLDADKKLFIVPDTHPFNADEAMARLVSRNTRNHPLPQNSDSVGVFLYRLVLEYTTTNGGTWTNVLQGSQEVWTNVSLVTSITSPDWPDRYPNGYAKAEQGEVNHGSPAEAIRFNFSSFDTEDGWDSAYTHNSIDEVKQTISGNLGAIQSNPIIGDSASIWFSSDSNIRRDGFESESYDWLETVLTGKEFISLK